jgi:hypothetical protein
MLVILSPVSDVLSETLGVPARFSQLAMAVLTGVLGGIIWWLAVERRRSYGYVAGTLAGVSAAVSTVGFWLLVFASVWGVELVLTGSVLVAFVAAVPFQ